MPTGLSAGRVAREPAFGVGNSIFGVDKSESAILASALAETGGVGRHASPGSTTKV
jgi:hypothetical protein